MSPGHVVAGRRRRGDSLLGLDHDEGTRPSTIDSSSQHPTWYLQLATPVTSRLGGVFKIQVGHW